MTSQHWEPADAVERDLADALAAGDGARYAARLADAPLIVAEPPAAETDEARRVAALLPPAGRYVLVFTSRSALTAAMGPGATAYEGLDLPTVLQRWPDPGHRLAVNPGTPIAAVLSPDELSRIAAGATPLVPLEAIRDAVAADVVDRLRRACLRDLGADEEDLAGWREAPAAGRLEADLRAAADRRDAHAFLDRLIPADVVVPTTSPVPGPDRLYEAEFPWLTTGDPRSPVIPVFTSVELLDRVAGAGTPRVETGFLDIAANWPGEEYVLCLDPGAATECVLTGAEVMDLVAAVIG